MKGDLTKHDTHRHVFYQTESLFPSRENSITDFLPGVLSSLTWKEILLSVTPISLDEKRCRQENKQRRERERAPYDEFTFHFTLLLNRDRSQNHTPRALRVATDF